MKPDGDALSSVSRGALVKFLIGKPGHVTRVKTPRLGDGLVAAEVFVHAGDTVHALTDGAKRAGYRMGCPVRTKGVG